MKKTDFKHGIFREMTEDENFASRGGGFAYDVGRFLRFVCIAGPRGEFTPMAIIDACVTAVL